MKAMQDKNGSWYVYKTNSKLSKYNPRKHTRRNTFMVKPSGTASSGIKLNHLSFKKEDAGKKIRLKIEFV